MESQFITEDPRKAHMFFIPIGCHKCGDKSIPHFSNATVLASVKNVLSNYPYWRPYGLNHFWMTCDGYDGNSMEAFFEDRMLFSSRVVSWPSMDGEYEHSSSHVFLPPVMGLPIGSPATAYHNKRRVSLQGRYRLLLARDAKMNMSSDHEMLAYVEKLYTSKGASSAQNQGSSQGVQQTRDPLSLPVPNLLLPIPNGLSVPTPSSFAIARAALQVTVAGGATEGVEEMMM
ncbi:hypothetical protein Tsubulata_046700 [Turnera subulata]|uniref:Exostosin GT47 domain-containing protein n=1 Tax=Turnera subulata TaxID=218843 RepID=A0A9Q0JBX8_9ROSI|nr:hypothetical protein Tsubulata_046700 [Turnera subulata]